MGTDATGPGRPDAAGTGPGATGIGASAAAAAPGAAGIDTDATTAAPGASGRHPFAEAAGMFFRNYSAVAGLAVLLVIVFAALVGPWLYPTDPFEMVWAPLAPPGEGGFLLGTDYLGATCWPASCTAAG